MLWSSIIRAKIQVVLSLTLDHLDLLPRPTTVFGTLREDKVGAFTGKKEFNRKYTFTVINRKKHDIHLQLEDQLPLVRTEEIVIDRLKLDGAKVHEASGQVMWDLTVKAGDLEERKMRYVIESPRELMVLAD